jgi:hypothetical protein
MVGKEEKILYKIYCLKNLALAGGIMYMKIQDEKFAKPWRK